MPVAGVLKTVILPSMSGDVESCAETMPQYGQKARRSFEPVKPWVTREEMASLVSRQPSTSWDEKTAQINLSLGRPQGSP